MNGGKLTTSRSRRKLKEDLNAILDLIGGLGEARGGIFSPPPPVRSAGLFFPPLWPQTLFQKAAIDKRSCGFQSLAPPPPRWCFWGAQGRGVRGGRRRAGLSFRGCSNQSPGTPCSQNRSSVRPLHQRTKRNHLSVWPPQLAQDKSPGQPPLTRKGGGIRRRSSSEVKGQAGCPQWGEKQLLLISSSHLPGKGGV